MTKRLPGFLLVALTVAFTLPLHADFSSIARAIDGQRGVKRIWIPFLGLARAVVCVARPEGVRDFQLAVFEGTDRLDPHELQRILVEKAGAGFNPLVRVWSRRSSESSFIYARPQPGGNRIELMILNHDGDETVLIRVEVDARELSKHLDDPRHVSRVARR